MPDEASVALVSDLESTKLQLEYTKLRVDYLKHLATLNTASIAAIGVLYGQFSKQVTILGTSLVILSILMFLGSLMFTVFDSLEEVSLAHQSLQKTQNTVVLRLSVYLFFAGVSFAAFYLGASNYNR